MLTNRELIAAKGRLKPIDKPDSIRVSRIRGRLDDQANGSARMQHFSGAGANFNRGYNLRADRDNESAVGHDRRQYSKANRNRTRTLCLKHGFQRNALQYNLGRARNDLVCSPHFCKADRKAVGPTDARQIVI